MNLSDSQGMRLSIAAVSGASLLGLCGSAALAAPLYQVMDLHTRYAFDLTGDGTVYVQNPGKIPTFSTIRNGQWTTLAVPAKSLLVDVSDHGYLLGKTAAGSYFTQSPAGSRKTLNKAPGSGYNQPGVINDAGLVAGVGYYGSVASLVVWKNGVATLPHVGVTGISAMNNSGVIAAGIGTNAYTVTGGITRRVPGPKQYRQSIFDVSDNNVAVGNLFDMTTSLGVAAVWSGSTYTRAGRLAGDQASWLLDVNDGGKAVGFSFGATDRATLWDGKTLLDLNQLLTAAPSGVKLTLATMVNDAGQILAHGTLNGRQTSFLLTPKAAVAARAENLTAIPEPAGIALLATASTLVSRRRRNKSATV